MLRYPPQYTRRSLYATGVMGLTGAAPQIGAGTTLDTGIVRDALGAIVYTKATTNTLAMTVKWQVLADDGATWLDVVESNNPAYVVSVTGTGSAVTLTKLYSAPYSVIAGNRSARCVVVTATGAGGGLGVDEFSIAYDVRGNYLP